MSRTTTGEQLGPYKLLRRIGRGGMAEIFVATQAGLDREVVVKRILPHLADDEYFAKMFLREARILGKLAHPNVVQIFDVGEHDGEVFIAMELLEGLTASQVARRCSANGRELSVPAVTRIISDAAAGLHHAHTLPAAQIVHRDISPDNIFVCEGGAVKVLDFGIAVGEATSRLTHTGEVKGKVKFMAPEQIEGLPLDPRSDLFSLGVTLYWLLTGQHPFTGQNELQVMRAVMERMPPAPSTLNSTVPKWLDDIALALLEKKREVRPASAAEVAERLEPYAGATAQRELAAALAAAMTQPPTQPPAAQPDAPVEGATENVRLEATRAMKPPTPPSPLSEETNDDSASPLAQLGMLAIPPSAPSSGEALGETTSPTPRAALSPRREASADVTGPNAPVALPFPSAESSSDSSGGGVFPDVHPAATLANALLDGPDTSRAMPAHLAEETVDSGETSELRALSDASALAAPPPARAIDVTARPRVGGQSRELRRGLLAGAGAAGVLAILFVIVSGSERAPPADDRHALSERPAPVDVAPPRERANAEPVDPLGSVATGAAVVPPPAIDLPPGELDAAPVPAPNMRIVKLVAPKTVRWKTFSGLALGTGTVDAQLPRNTAAVFAFDDVHKGKIVVKITGDSVALDKQPHGMLAFAASDAQVAVGTLKLGRARGVKPMLLPAGTYEVRISDTYGVRVVSALIKPNETTTVGQ